MTKPNLPIVGPRRLILLLTISFLHLPADVDRLLAVEKTKPIPIIFDSDMGNDVDDVMAMGVIHSLQTRGECELLAVTITKDHELAAPFVDAVNTFYGRGDIPIGVCNSGVEKQLGKFLAMADKRDGQAFRYPHDLLSGKAAPQAVEVLRKTLAAAEDGTVVVAQVGFSTNLADLLSTSSDEFSPLSGIELVRKKVRLLSIMAGAFAPIANEKTGKIGRHKEYNVMKDIPSCQKLVREWPTPIWWSGFEIGIALRCPYESIDRDYAYVEHHPIVESYWMYNPPKHNRPTWDLTSVLMAVRPDHGYFDLSSPGLVAVDDEGYTTFTEVSAGRDRCLKLNESQKIKTLEALIQLSSQPPK